MGAARILILFTFGIIFSAAQLCGQKVLDEHKTLEILEAQAKLQQAYSDPALSERDRLEMIRKSTTKLKEYGQPAFPPPDELPLRTLMEENYRNKQWEAIQANNLIGELNQSLLKNKSKFINNLQIDVTSEQIKFLIPGVTPIDMSSDAVSTLFQWNIVDGAHGGQQKSAKNLKEKVLQLIGDKDSIDRVELQKQYKFRSLERLDKDRKDLDKLEKKIRKTFKDALSSTRTIRGYEDSQLYSGETHGYDPRLLGIWTYSNIGFIVTHQYYNDGNCSIRVNSKQNNMKYVTSNGWITYTKSNGKKYKMGYTIESNKLYYGTKRSRKKAGHPLTKGF